MRSSAPFFAIAFGFTWALQLPAALATQGLLRVDPASLLPLAMLGIFGPTVAAVTLAARAEGTRGVRALLRPLAAFRVSPGWYVAALLLPGLLLTLGLALLRLAGREGPISYVPDAAGIVVGCVVALAEETGWRGYAQPRLEQRHGPVAASTILGVLWTLWHIPMFMAVGVSLTLLPLMLVYFVGGSFYFTWILRGTGGSVLLVVLAHLGAHLNNSHRAIPGDLLPLVVNALVYAGLGLVVSVAGPRLARRKREA